MRKRQETLQNENTTNGSILYIAFELSDKNWKLASSDGNKRRYFTITARDLPGLQNELKRARWHFRIGAFSKIVTCYEAGRDGCDYGENHRLLRNFVDGQWPRPR